MNGVKQLDKGVAEAGMEWGGRNVAASVKAECTGTITTTRESA